MLFPSLDLEITRRCNMLCGHCMRGEPQNVLMSDAIIEAVLRQVGEIRHLLFTGGEPSIAPSRMMKTLEVCKHYHLGVGSINIVTNAKRVSPAFIEALEAWKLWTDAIYMSVSRDQFHDKEINTDNLARLQDLIEGYDDNFCIRGAISLQSVIGEGRGYYIAEGGRNALKNCGSWDDGDFDGEIYVNALGQLINGGDFSYENQAERVICTVFDDIGAELKRFYARDYEKALRRKHNQVVPA